MQASFALFALSFLGLFAQAAHAQADPTRPPPGWNAQQRGALQEAEAPRTGQVVVTGAQRRFVVVDGHAVHLGETYNGAKLLSVDGERVVWQRGGTRELADMNPNAKKSPVRPAGAALTRPASHPQKVSHPGEGR